MRLFTCTCGATLFFDNSQCMSCGRRTGWVPSCLAVTALEPAGDHWRALGEPQKGNGGQEVQLCANTRHGVCNRTVPVGQGELCDCCRFNRTIPDLSVPGNLERWQRLEAAKRRLFYGLDRLGLPYGTAEEGFDPALGFAFMGDPPEDGLWRMQGEAERVYTGHANGLITINIREADPAEREKIRVDMGEAHRTLIGHFRHEIGHYYWDLLIRGRQEYDFAARFGDPWNPSYGEALERYYANGPLQGWQGNYVSAYATMHPWEDWAETWAVFMAMVSVIDTAEKMGLIHRAPTESAAALVAQYKSLGLVLNELNREMGLKDFVPQILTDAITAKLDYVYQVIRGASRGGFLDNDAPM